MIIDDLESIYRRRFGKDIEFRKKMYEVICREFFQKYIPENSRVLDIAAGYCEFVNNIKAEHRIALDINPDVRKFAEKDVEVIVAPSTDMESIDSGIVDVAFTSNFLEHISKVDIVKTVKEVHRVLRKDGLFLILQPNIRYCYKKIIGCSLIISPL